MTPAQIINRLIERLDAKEIRFAHVGDVVDFEYLGVKYRTAWLSTHHYVSVLRFSGERCIDDDCSRNLLVLLNADKASSEEKP